MSNTCIKDFSERVIRRDVDRLVRNERIAWSIYDDKDVDAMVTGNSNMLRLLKFEKVTDPRPGEERE